MNFKMEKGTKLLHEEERHDSLIGPARYRVDFK
jgi:hypothetical protein